jgi:hypothetical protein
LSNNGGTYLLNQIAGAYDILHRYEMGADEGDHSVDVVAPSTWGLEAAGWTSTYEKITKKLIDDDVVQYPAESMKFHEFASALQPPKKYMEAEFDTDNGGYSVHLSDSSKTRREILVRIFKPLLGDIFSFNVVNQLFEALGIKKDCEYLLKVRQSLRSICFSWFTSHSFVVLWRVVHLSFRESGDEESDFCGRFAYKQMVAGYYS